VCPPTKLVLAVSAAFHLQAYLLAGAHAHVVRELPAGVNALLSRSIPPRAADPRAGAPGRERYRKGRERGTPPSTRDGPATPTTRITLSPTPTTPTGHVVGVGDRSQHVIYAIDPHGSQEPTTARATGLPVAGGGGAVRVGAEEEQVGVKGKGEERVGGVEALGARGTARDA
jgi:hypothetical protein